MRTISILIPTIVSRAALFSDLTAEINRQICTANAKNTISISSLCDNKEKSIGLKRNYLLQKAETDYTVFVDDDDWVSPNYIDTLISASESDCDVCELKGLLTIDGKIKGEFQRSIRYNSWKLGPKANWMLRPPDHLCMMKRTLVRNIPFREKGIREDVDWSLEIAKQKVLHKEFNISEHYYYYRFSRIGTATQNLL